MKQTANTFLATAFVILATSATASAENLKLNFYSGSQFIGGVPVTDTRSGSCYSGSLKYLGEMCGIDLYICSSNSSKYNDLRSRASGAEVQSQDRPGYPVICG